MANAGASPADATRARSALDVTRRPPPAAALDPATVAQSEAISQLQTASSRQDKPHVVVLAGASAPPDWPLSSPRPQQFKLGKIQSKSKSLFRWFLWLKARPMHVKFTWDFRFGSLWSSMLYSPKMTKMASLFFEYKS